MNAVVEAANIEEICWSWLPTVQSCHFARAYIGQSSPEVKRVLYLLSNLCMKTCSTSKRITALTYPGRPSPDSLAACIFDYKL